MSGSVPVENDGDSQPDRCERCGQRHGPEAAYSCFRCQAMVCGTQLYVGTRHGFLPNSHIGPQDASTVVHHQAFLFQYARNEKRDKEMVPYDCGPVDVAQGDPIRKRLFADVRAELKEKEEKLKKDLKAAKGANMSQAQKKGLYAAQHATRRPRRA